MMIFEQNVAVHRNVTREIDKKIGNATYITI